MYKDTKRHISHTGGGDGDAPPEGPGLVTDFENEAVTDTADAKAESSQSKTEDTTRRYAAAAMDRFAHSAVFEVIDRVYAPMILFLSRTFD